MIYCYPLDTLIRSALFDEIVLVCPPNRMDIPEDHVAKGGATRQESSYLGILAFKQRPDIVLIHDAVRPFVTLRILKDNVEGAVRWGAVEYLHPFCRHPSLCPISRKDRIHPNQRTLPERSDAANFSNGLDLRSPRKGAR